jgi:hypothetical protein
LKRNKKRRNGTKREAGEQSSASLFACEGGKSLFMEGSVSISKYFKQRRIAPQDCFRPSLVVYWMQQARFRFMMMGVILNGRTCTQRENLTGAVIPNEGKTVVK